MAGRAGHRFTAAGLAITHRAGRLFFKRFPKRILVILICYTGAHIREEKPGAGMPGILCSAVIRTGNKPPHKVHEKIQLFRTFLNTVPAWSGAFQFFNG